MNKSRIFAAAVAGLVISCGAFAADTTICNGSSTAQNGEVPTSGGDDNFMVTAIAPKCSANVHLAGGDGTNGAWYAVGSASKKGKSIFSGHTNGGAVAPLATGCAVAGGCTGTEAESGRDAANEAAQAGSSS